MRIGKEKRGVYTQSSLYGIELRSIQRTGRASKMRNLLSVDAGIRKRNGFRDVAILQDAMKNPVPVHGIYSFGEKKIVHAGQWLYKCPSDFSSAVGDVFSDAERIWLGDTLQNAKTDAAEQNGRLWLLSNGELLVFDGQSVNKVYDTALAHIPTTRKSIMPTNMGAGYEQGESENLLCSQRINTAVGAKATGAFYELDEKIDTGKGFLLTCDLDLAINGDETQASYMAYTNPEYVSSNQIASVMGAPAPSEIYNMFDGIGTNYYFNFIEEINVFFKQPIRVTDLAIYAPLGAVVPKIKLSLGAETVFESKEEESSGICNYTNSVENKLIDCFTIFGSERDARIDKILMMAKQGYQGQAQITYKSDSVALGKVYQPSSVLTPDGKELTLYSDYEGILKASTGITISEALDKTGLKMFFSAPCYVRDRANIQIQFYKRGAEQPRFYLAKECKTDTGKQVLALHTGGNGLAFTDAERGFGYVPRAFCAQLGDNEDITAICQLHDFSIGVYKRDCSFYIKLGKGGVQFDGAMESIGCINKDCAVTIKKDTMILSKQGVYGAQGQSSSGFSLRSGPINSELIKSDLDSAFCVSYDGRLYLFLKEGCYVGDTRFKCYHSDMLDDGYEYEWFLLDNMNASCASVIDNELYIGTPDGKIRTRTKGFSDIEYQRLGRGEISVSTELEKTRFYFDKSLGVHDGVIISLCNGYKLLCNIASQQVIENKIIAYVNKDELFDKNGYARIYEGMTVYLDNSEGPIEAKITCVDYTSLYITLESEGANPDTAYPRMLVSCNGEYSLVSSGDGYAYYLLDDREIQLHYEADLKAAIVKKSPVCAEYETTPLSLDCPNSAKNLHRIAINLLPTASVELTVGYESSDTAYSKKHAMSKSFSLDNLDFDAFNFFKEVQHGIVVRCFERGFDCLKLKLSSNSDSDLAIAGYSIVYTFSGLLKGERI